MCTKKHLVIGSGFVGLIMAKTLKQQKIPYDQVDSNSEVGGTWYRGFYPHVFIISSKKTTQCPDFPMPDDYPDFPSAKQIFSYLQQYTSHFQLKESIEFNKTVKLVCPSADEMWEVTFEDGEIRKYKGVIVCNGHHWKANYPNYPGTGKYIHSKDYIDNQILENKKVLVIGGGNSACDVAVNAVKAAKESHISMRRGYWFLPKIIWGIPIVEFARTLPVWLQSILIKLLLRISIGKYESYGLQKPDHKLFEKIPVVNSLLLYYLKHGTIKIHQDIKRIDGKKVLFTDETSEEFDLIIAATGYQIDFPFFPKDFIEIKKAIPQLPEGTFHPKYRGLYLVGWNQVHYGVGPVMSAGAPNICLLIKAQDQMKRPLGYLLQRLGVKIPNTHIRDPIKAIKICKRGRLFIGLLPFVEKLLFGNKPYNKPLGKIEENLEKVS